METETLLDVLQEEFRRRAEQAWIKLNDLTALASAANCLADAKELTNPVEQVKYLYDRFKDEQRHFMNIPWAWLNNCLEKGLIKNLPKEDWVICLFIHRAKYLGGDKLVSQFLLNYAKEILIPSPALIPVPQDDHQQPLS